MLKMFVLSGMPWKEPINVYEVKISFAELASSVFSD